MASRRNIEEVDARVSNREIKTFRVKCSVKCAKLCTVEIAQGRVQGARVSWLRIPEGWWIFIPKNPLDVDSLHVRCPEHITCPGHTSEVES